MKKIWSFIKDEQGLETVEYAIMGAMISAAVVIAITALSPALVTRFTALLNAVNGTP